MQFKNTQKGFQGSYYLSVHFEEHATFSKMLSMIRKIPINFSKIVSIMSVDVSTCVSVCVGVSVCLSVCSKFCRLSPSAGQCHLLIFKQTYTDRHA